MTGVTGLIFFLILHFHHLVETKSDRMRERKIQRKKMKRNVKKQIEKRKRFQRQRDESECVCEGNKILPHGSRLEKMK